MAAEPLVSPTLDNAEAIRLAARITYGVDRATAETVRRLGYEGFVEWQLDHERIDDSELEGALRAQLPTLSMDAAELAEFLRNAEQPGQAQRELVAATLLRQAFSPRQLYERMIEFWSDHFNVTVGNLITSFLKPLEDRQVIRPLAMGRFEDLLQADAKSPAMLYYLDNFSNTVDGPNENYSRELMELHTLGVDGGYTEDDVKEAARVFTGWTIRPPGRFVFSPRDHDYGEKDVLGEHFPIGVGRREGERLLSLLAAHPSTAFHIATKLARRFVSDQPEPDVVAAVADAFTASGGDVREMLRALLLHRSVRAAPAQKLKRPNEFVAGVLRGLEVGPQEGVIRAAFGALDSAGQVPFQWPAPNGYPDVRPYWQSSIGFLMRFNSASVWTRGAAGRSPLLNQSRAFRDPAQQVGFLAAALVPQGIDRASRDRIAGHAAKLAGRDRPPAIAALLLAGPENQWR